MTHDTVIRVSNLGKRYSLGAPNGDAVSTLREKISETLKSKIRNLSASNTNRTKVNPGNQREFWALRNVDFNITQGSVCGIVGRNGAGKSTLLKILSRITEPTLGQVELRGRVSSLLEVGTGFHPELTGRENIFLNGAILGMSKAEVRSNFDDIVQFAGVEQFLDTPVKRYSSGMYVRLAFAVAAHLRPEILIIDEVLAVGDLEFQKKCIGKMQDVAHAGRTVLFVSHNLPVVSSLCSTGILLEGGGVAFTGSIQDTIDRYLKSATSTIQMGLGSSQFISSIKVLDQNGNLRTSFPYGSTVIVEIGIHARDEACRLNVGISLNSTRDGRRVFGSNTELNEVVITAAAHPQLVRLTMQDVRLAPGIYLIDFGVVSANRTSELLSGIYTISIEADQLKPALYVGADMGTYIPEHNWSVTSVQSTHHR